jgi:hypothetical protein
MIILATIGTGLAVAAATYFFTALAEGDEWGLSEAEKQRRETLRNLSLAYRWFGPSITTLAAWHVQFLPGLVEWMKGRLALAEGHSDAPWADGEFLATKMVEALPAFLVGCFAGTVFMGPIGGLFFGLVACAITTVATVRGVAGLAQQRVETIRQRLPGVVDLMALMLEAGAGTLRECLAKVALENADHPLGDEVSRALVRMDQGNSQADALKGLADRLDDPEVRDLVFALVTAEDRGVPLKVSLRELSTQMRIRHVQRLERAAEEARVHITWPGLLMTFGCLLIVAAPIIIPLFAR